MKELLKKLASVKREIGTLSKNASNPFFKSKYLDLNEILTHLEPLLEKNGLILLQPVTGDTVCTQIHDTASGDSVTSCINLPAISDPQKIGSAITYYRRYSLQSLLALQAEDDDANRASSHDEKPVKIEAVKALPTLNESNPLWKAICEAVVKGERTIPQLKTKFLIDKKTEQILSLLK